MENNARSGTIDFMRIVFAIAILVFHGKQVFDVPFCEGNIFIRGAYGVDFFFIVSGYLLMAHVSNENRKSPQVSWNKICEETFGYVAKRVKCVFPYHVLAFFITFIVQISMSSYGVDSINEVISYFVLSLPQLSLIQLSGIYILNVNSVTWYLSGMLIMIVILYPCLRKNSSLFSKIILPIIYILMWSWLLNEKGTLLANWAEWNGFVYFGMLKACAEMLLGVITFNIAECISHRKSERRTKIYFTLFEVIGYIGIMFFMCTCGDGKYAFVLVPVLAVSIAISFSGISYSNYLFKGKWVYRLSSITLPLYLNQMWCRYLVKSYSNVIMPKICEFQMYIIYLILSLSVALITEFGFANIKNKFIVKEKYEY